jgi:hypothetical protein
MLVSSSLVGTSSTIIIENSGEAASTSGNVMTATNDLLTDHRQYIEAILNNIRNSSYE